MRLTYLFHSGFCIESPECVLIVDFFMDPAEKLDKILQTSKPIYVLSSHFHEDHFTKKIFEWRKSIRNITYILSKDIVKRRRAQKEDADVWMAKDAQWDDENIKVTASGSNDSGVSWIVEVEGQKIFHAGDLCNWYARFLSEEIVPETIISDEFGEINPIAEEKQFLGELKDVARLANGTHFDIVMFPVDGRIGNGYTLGGRQFIDRFNVGHFVPMHFVASGFESAWRMEPFCTEKGIPFWCIKSEGDSLSL